MSSREEREVDTQSGTDDDEDWDGRGNEGDDLFEVGDVGVERDGLTRGGVEKDCTNEQTHKEIQLDLLVRRKALLELTSVVGTQEDRPGGDFQTSRLPSFSEDLLRDRQHHCGVVATETSIDDI